MSTTPSTARPKRSRSTRTATPGTSSQAATTGGPVMTAEQRRALIAESAYLRAERRGFQGGDPIADWLESEREVDLVLSRRAD
ncbi:MAG TPA: DUF2934 domain-containing protein [Gammaproteobacteria bacterium]|nr:DUF2934 domain-containing protein [Gammaproteobacteria bacterium]